MMSLPLYSGTFQEYDSWRDLGQELERLGCDGIEGVWGGEDLPKDLPAELILGYHLIFYPDWLDFYRDDRAALKQKFGSLEAVASFYGGLGPDTLLEQYRADLRRAVNLGARYVVFHVSDVSLEEGYTYRWLPTPQEVIDAAVEVVNLILGEERWPFEFLVENQWWPGFTFTEPEETARLLEGIRFAGKGILLDTGHLMNACTELKTEAEGADYIRRMLNRHGSLATWVRGVHLHQSLSGAYVKAHTGLLPAGLPEDYGERFGVSYQHILQIDQHRPWTDPAILPVLEQIGPRYLTHELSSRGRMSRAEAMAAQARLFQQGGKMGV
ncbi:TIM barrel protein [Bacteroides thetaiotaomicron]|nr:TIM barrel protein [Bacteroides thetaiotaomicron]